MVTDEHVYHAKPEKHGDDEETRCVTEATDTYGDDCIDKKYNCNKHNNDLEGVIDPEILKIS